MSPLANISNFSVSILSMAICYLGVGSNLGNRRRNIKIALEKINKLKSTRILKFSRIIETKAQGGPASQPKFLNACLKIQTGLTPLNLLRQLKKIEKDIGRAKTVRWGPRVIDLDILLFGRKKINQQDLIVPHPRMREREFVLRPLREIAPEFAAYCSSEPRTVRCGASREPKVFFSTRSLRSLGRRI